MAKKIILILILSLFIADNFSLAAPLCLSSSNTKDLVNIFLAQIENPLGNVKFLDVVNKLLNFIFTAAIIIVPLVTIYAAFLLATSQGDVTNVNRAKSIIFWTVIALAVVLLAKGLPAMIKALLGIK